MRSKPLTYGTLAKRVAPFVWLGLVGYSVWVFGWLDGKGPGKENSGHGLLAFLAAAAAAVSAVFWLCESWDNPIGGDDA